MKGDNSIKKAPERKAVLFFNACLSSSLLLIFDAAVHSVSMCTLVVEERGFDGVSEGKGSLSIMHV